MRPIYEINADIERCILNGTNYETGEFLAFDALNDLEMERAKKIEGVVLYSKDARAEAAAIKAEIETLTARMRRLLKNADGAEEWVAYQLCGENFSTPRCACTFRRSEAVTITDEDAVLSYCRDHGLEDLYTRKESISLSKPEIKKFLKDGNVLPGAAIEQRKNLVIK